MSDKVKATFYQGGVKLDNGECDLDLSINDVQKLIASLNFMKDFCGYQDNEALPEYRAS